MIKNLNDKLDKICSLPRPTRNEVREILIQCYREGHKDGEDKIKSSVKYYKGGRCPICNSKGNLLIKKLRKYI